MRFLTIPVLLCLALSFSSCKTTQKASEDKTLLKIDSVANSVKKIQLFKEKKLEISEVNGGLMYKLVENKQTNVVLFTYERDMEQLAIDGGYSEEVVFEIPNDKSEQKYTDKQLQNTKMLFGRHCFCRGKNGLFRVSQGNLHVDSSKKKLRFELDFKITEVPQETERIEY